MHFSVWAGAMSGLRIVNAFMAIGMACAYRHVLVRMVGRRFAANGGDVMGGSLAVISAGVFVQAAFGLSLIAKSGHVPADDFLWSRLFVATFCVLFNAGFTIAFAGMATRAWLARGMSFEKARRQGQFTYYRIAAITIGTMVTGAALAMVNGA